jgi:hypothetical protein
MLAAAMGWIGTVGTISAYVMLSRGLVNASSIRYGVLNLTGGLLGAAGSTAYGAWPSVASNLIWAGVALQSILVTLHARRELPAGPVALAPEPPREQSREPATDPWPDTLKMPAIVGVA